MIIQEAISVVENNGIVFLDEIDKICARSERRRRRRQPRRRAARSAAADRRHHGRHQIRPGQNRPYPVHRLRRVHMLQAVGPAAGTSGPAADPGRARALTKEDFKRILTEPQASLIKQYMRLSAPKGSSIEFTEDGIVALANIAADINASSRISVRAGCIR